MELRYDPLTDPTRLEQAFSDYENGRKNYHFHELPPLPEDDVQIPLTKKKSRHAKAWSDIAWEQFQEWQCRDRKTLHRLQQKIVRERRIPFIIEAPPIPTDIVQFLHRIVLCYSIISHFSLVDLFWQKSLWPCLTKSDCCGHTSCRA